MGHYRVLPHTADTAIEVVAPSLSDLIATAARAMFALMYGDLPAEGPHEVATRIPVVPQAELVVDALSELLFLGEVSDLAFGDVAVTLTEAELSLRARGVALESTELVGPPIKAVTYHDLAVERSDDGWRATIVFDV
jgi:SHS2 domain-containing protein